MAFYDSVMCDIETTGTNSDRNAILQITAIRFDLNTHAVDPNIFNQCLEIPPARFWDEGTRMWWADKVDTLTNIFDRARRPKIVMEEFYDWTGGTNTGLHFWSKPLSFDFPFVSSYFRDLEMHMPYHFAAGRDLRTFLAGLTFPDNPFDERSVPFQGTEHDALYDTAHQIRILFAALDARKCIASSETPI